MLLIQMISIIPNMFSNISGNKSNTYERDWSKFLLRKFYSLYYFFVDWEYLLKTYEINAFNHLIRMYLDKINMLLDIYALLK